MTRLARSIIAPPAVAVLAAIVGLCGCAAGPTAKVDMLDTHGFRTDPWNFAGIEGIKITTPRYHLFSTARTDFALRMAAFMEAASDRYDELTGLPPVLGNEDDSADNPDGNPQPRPDSGKKMKVYLLANRAQWAALTERFAGSSATTALKITAGGYCLNGICVFWDIGNVQTARVAMHEGLHQYLAHRLYHRLPEWAEESLAVSAEGFELLGKSGQVTFDSSDNHDRRVTLSKLIYADRLRTVEQLVTMSATDNLDENSLYGADYYAQLWALAEMIRSDARYAGSYGKLCAAAAAGKLREQLGISRSRWLRAVRNGRLYNQTVSMSAFVTYVLGGDETALAGFEKDYLAFARQQAQPQSQ